MVVVHLSRFPLLNFYSLERIVSEDIPDDIVSRGNRFASG
jgi:hypothetical protein